MALLLSVPGLGAATTLADGLDATNLVWDTGGTDNAGWLYEPDPYGGVTSLDGIASARSGQVGDNGESWIQTTVVGPGAVSFWWRACSQPPGEGREGDRLEFYVGASLQGRICGALSSGSSDWKYCSFPVPSGTNVLKWRYVKDATWSDGTYDCGWVDRVSYVPSSPPLVSQALNTSGVAWSSAGSVYANGWFAQTNVTHDSEWAAQSGAVWHNQTNWLQTTVSGTTNVSFWWKASSESDFDVLEFYTNGVLAKQISGEVDWEYNYFTLPVTSNILTWLYRKDDTYTMGSDCGWVDQVTFNTTFKSLPFTLQPPVRLPDGRMQVTVTGEAGSSCRIEYSANPTTRTNWSLLTNLTATSANTTIIDSAAANSPVRFYRTVSP